LKPALRAAAYPVQFVRRCRDAALAFLRGGLSWCWWPRSRRRGSGCCEVCGGPEWKKTDLEVWWAPPPPPPPEPAPAPATSAFPLSQLVTAEQATQINTWSGNSASEKWELCYSSFHDKSIRSPWGNAANFHTQCDQHNTTVTVAHNAWNYTFGGFATASWDAAACCADPANLCEHASWERLCNISAENSRDFIFRLSPSPAKFGLRPGQANNAQGVWGDWCWPKFGDDLNIGGCTYGTDNRPPYSGPLGSGGCQNPGSYTAKANQVCGGPVGSGSDQWNKTDVEVWWKPQ
jgi:hypothetical protein